MARKYVRQIKESQYHQGFSYNQNVNNNGELVYNYDNPDVIVSNDWIIDIENIRDQLGDFDFGDYRKV